MSAAAERAAFAAVAGDLIALRGDAGVRRAAGLLARSGDAPTGRFVDLLAAPAWLRQPREAQTRLAHAAALRSIAPSLAGSIDGAWLGALAEVAGEEAVDWAIARGEADARPDEAPVAPEMLAAHGFALLRAALPPGLRCYLDWALPGTAVRHDVVVVEDALAFVGPGPA